MYKFKIIRLLLIISISFFYSVEIVAENYLAQLPEEAWQKISKREANYPENIDSARKSFEKYLYKYENFDGEIDEGLIKIIDYTKKPFLMTLDMVKEDVDFFFRILKYGYAGYQYFGGDEKFESVKNKIIEEINQTSIFSRLTTNSFSDILLKHLSFIQDGHFGIDGEGVVREYVYYTTNEYDFFKDKEGYYTWLVDGKYYLVSINGGNYRDYLKLSLNNRGEVVFRIGMVAEKENHPVKIQISLTSVHNEKRDISLDLVREDRSYHKEKTPYNVFRKQDIPIIEHRTASATPANRDKLEQFAQEASQFKDEEYIVFDLRGNSGGADIYASDWVKNYTGISPGEGLVESTLVTNTANQLLENSFKKIYDMKITELEPEYQKLFMPTKSGWTEIKYHKNKLIENDGLVIALIDNGVASAGESFVKYLKQLSNVIFIGTNTAGVLHFANMGMCNLPNSKIEVFLSKTISMEADFNFREGKGYFPDFWVNPEEALDLSLKFISNYSQ